MPRLRLQHRQGVEPEAARVYQTSWVQKAPSGSAAQGSQCQVAVPGDGMQIRDKSSIRPQAPLDGAQQSGEEPQDV